MRTFFLFFGGKILFVGPLLTPLKNKEWSIVERSFKKGNTSDQDYFDLFKKSPNFKENVLNSVSAIDRYSWTYSLGGASLKKDLVITEDYENSKQKFKEGAKLLIPFVPVGSHSAKNVSYPLNLNINNKSMHAWYFFILNESFHRGLRNKIISKKGRKIESWISKRISKKLPIMKSQPRFGGSKQFKQVRFYKNYSISKKTSK